MKRFASSCLLALILLSGAFADRAVAQNYSKSISANPLGLAVGWLNATFENRVGPSNSFTIFGSYWSYADWSAYGIGGSYRWYFDLKDGKNALQGLSAGPFISIGFWSWNGFIANYYSGGTSVAIGGELAYKWVFGGFVVEPILQLGFNANKITGLDYRSYGLGVNLGYAW